MAGQLKLRRGTTSQLANFIGSEGELTYDTVLKSLVLHDGVTLGGVKIPYLSNDLVPSTMLPIATTAIAQAGTNDTDIITPLKLKNTVFGLGQTWQVLTASRAINTTYTNTTGRPIEVMISVSAVEGLDSHTIFIDGLDVSGLMEWGLSYMRPIVTFTVPSGSTYKYQALAGALVKWSELR